MENNTQSRKWALVVNNPLEAGLDHAAIREIRRSAQPLPQAAEESPPLEPEFFIISHKATLLSCA